jgi:hypothetical protein
VSPSLFFCAQSLERAQSDGDEVKAQLQFVLAPMVAEQVRKMALFHVAVVFYFPFSLRS